MPLPVRFGFRLWKTLRDLGRAPWLLTGLLLLLNALVMPYLGIIHDAQLYSGLVLNRIDPEFLGDDLFFRFGSQDQYSIFSPLMAPIVELVGLKRAFFVGYLVSIALLLAALVRIVTRLWPDSPGAVVGLIFLSIVPVAYGGYVPLHVIEPFLSARVPASALTLWGLAELLDRRRLRGSLFLAAAFAVHPLMALPGIMLVCICAVANRWGTLGVAIVGSVGFALFAGLLAVPTIAFRLFGHFDSRWLELTQMTNCYQFPQEWSAAQWFWNLFALAGLGAAAWHVRNKFPDRSRVLAAAMLIGLAGFFGTLAFTNLPYALLLKGQAYRWLWLPLALTPPALLDLAWSYWRSNQLTARLAAIGIVVGLGVTTYAPLEFAMFAFFVPPILYGLVAFAKSWSFTDKFSWSLLGSVLIGMAVWSGFRLWIYFVLCDDLRAQATLMNQFEIVCAALGIGVLVPLILVGLAAANRRLFSPGRSAIFVAAALAFQIGIYGWMNSDSFRSNIPQGDEVRFVEQFLREKRGPQPQGMCVYSDYGQLGQYWVEWRTRSFYDCFQLAGFVFNRDTAIEGKRRAGVVAPFEAAALSKGSWEVFPEMCKEHIEAWLETDVSKAAAPSEKDILRLAQEDGIDYIVLFKSHVDSLACARHGDVSIYDCRALRQMAAKLPEKTAVASGK